MNTILDYLFIFDLTGYGNVQNIHLQRGESLHISTLNYPRDTYADSKWIITSAPHLKLIISFIDFNITFGVSLTVGRGDTFDKNSKIIAVGSKDVVINPKDVVLTNQTVIWIWFQISDPSTKLQSEHTIDLHQVNSNLNFESYPSVHGIKLQLHTISNGKRFLPFLKNFAK